MSLGFNVYDVNKNAFTRTSYTARFEGRARRNEPISLAGVIWNAHNAFIGSKDIEWAVSAAQPPLIREMNAQILSKPRADVF